MMVLAALSLVVIYEVKFNFLKVKMMNRVYINFYLYVTCRNMYLC
jgi:hypothetical protein